MYLTNSRNFTLKSQSLVPDNNTWVYLFPYLSMFLFGFLDVKGRALKGHYNLFTLHIELCSPDRCCFPRPNWYTPGSQHGHTSGCVTIFNKRLIHATSNFTQLTPKRSFFKKESLTWRLVSPSSSTGYCHHLPSASWMLQKWNHPCGAILAEGTLSFEEQLHPLQVGFLSA